MVTDEMTQRIAERIQSQREHIERVVANFENSIVANRKRLSTLEETATKEVSQTFQAKQLLEASGFAAKMHSWGLHIDVEVEEKDLTKIYHAIGRLDPRTVFKEIVDAREKLVKVLIRSVHFPNVTIAYQKKLKPTDKCRIEKAEPEYALVCVR